LLQRAVQACLARAASSAPLATLSATSDGSGACQPPQTNGNQAVIWNRISASSDEVERCGVSATNTDKVVFRLSSLLRAAPLSSLRE